ncbi:MAG: c-type cytochrome [Hylemonella sp.]
MSTPHHDGRRRPQDWLRPVLALGLLLAALLAWLLWPATPIDVTSTSTPAADAGTIERGRYLATLGNCQHCHTARGSAPFAGGRAITTPFGTVYSSNLTPSPAGLGGWRSDDFWRALHHGQSRDGRWLSPAFPYNNTTHITRADSDALYAFLHQLPPVDVPAPAHQLRWPFNTQAALKVWRTLYFEEGQAEVAAADLPANAMELQRGAYLVRGLGHCSACHAPRNALGASGLDPAGGLIPAQNWYAPSLTNPLEAGVQDWPVEDIVALLRDGRAGTAVVTGPMAEVVQHSTQHWQAADLRAVARHLQQLPRTETPRATAPAAVPAPLGARLYEKHCAQCHGEQGQGIRGRDGQWAYPPLAGNRAVTLASPANLVQMVLNGGFAPATTAHPRPFGMPPFVLTLSDSEVATLLTYLRTQWGHQAPPVSELDVQRLRESAAR